jgi:chromate transporter
MGRRGPPDHGTLRAVPLVIAVVAGVLVFRRRWSVLQTLGVCALLGLTAGLAGLPVT